MRKSLVLLSLFIVCSVSAQTEHLKFMGIPLDGRIESFQTQLERKGFKLIPHNSAYPVNTRAFEGIFSGERSNVYVWYNPRTHIVYRAKAMLTRESKELIGQLLDIMESKLLLKYGEDHLVSLPFKDDFGHEFTQYSRFLESGSIDLFVNSTGYSSQNTFFLHVDYKDKENSRKNTQDEMDDL